MGVASISSEREPDRRSERLSESMLPLQQALDGCYVLERKLGKGGMLHCEALAAYCSYRSHVVPQDQAGLEVRMIASNEAR